MWWMMCPPECLCSDSVSEACSASPDNSIYTTHRAWSHHINMWARFPFSRGICDFVQIRGVSVTPHRRCPCSGFFSVSKITFCPSCRRVAYSARLKCKDLHLGDNRWLICAVMWDEVKADRETVMNLSKIVPSSTTTEPGGLQPFCQLPAHVLLIHKSRMLCVCQMRYNHFCFKFYLFIVHQNLIQIHQKCWRQNILRIDWMFFFSWWCIQILLSGLLFSSSSSDCWHVFLMGFVQTLQGAAMSHWPSLKSPQQITAQGGEE